MRYHVRCKSLPTYLYLNKGVDYVTLGLDRITEIENDRLIIGNAYLIHDKVVDTKNIYILQDKTNIKLNFIRISEDGMASNFYVYITDLSLNNIELFNINVEG